MALWNDLITPAELSTYGRKSLAQLEAEKGSLAAFLPSEAVDDSVAKFTRTEGGLVGAAEYRSYDTEASIGAADTGQQVTIALPPVSKKNRIGELDTIRSRAQTDEQKRITIAKETDRVVASVRERLELQRGNVLETGRVTINENGFKVDYDLARHKDLTTTAGNLWNTDDADPIADMIAWAEKYNELNGKFPGTILASRSVLSTLQRSATVQKMVAGAGSPSIVSVDGLNALLASYDLPTITVYDRSVKVGNTVNRVLSANKVFMLPESGTDELGKTVLGMTAEAGDPEYQFAAQDELPGLVVSALREHDPYSHWVRANAIALPVLTAPNASMVATVL